MHSASRAEMPRRRPRAIFLVEGSGGALGEQEALSVNRHEEIASASRNLLASKAVALTSHQWRPFALVAHITAVASAGQCGFCFAHTCRVGARSALLNY